MGNMLKPALARGDLQLMGATTLDEYRIIEKDAALARRFQSVYVEEPNVEDTISILRGLKTNLELHHAGIRIKDEALVAAATLSDRYYTDRFQPDKSIDLVGKSGLSDISFGIAVGSKISYSFFSHTNIQMKPVLGCDSNKSPNRRSCGSWNEI